MKAMVGPVAFCLMVLALPSQAQTIYKCVDKGVTSFQQAPCEGAEAPTHLRLSHSSAPLAVEGAWKIDPSTMHRPSKSRVLLLQNGQFECKSCDPPITVKADGSDQKVSGQKSYDAVAIKIVDGHTIEETHKKYGRAVATRTTAVSADGKTATELLSVSTNSGPLTSKSIFRRVGDGPAASHAISGTWQEVSVASFSDPALMFNFEMQEGMLTYTDPLGGRYRMILDGTQIFTGTEGFSVKMIDKNTLQETTTDSGKTTRVQTMVVAPDGKSMSITRKDLKRGMTDTMVAKKQ